MKSNDPTDLSFKSFIKNFANEAFLIDSSIIRSIIVLVAKPGHSEIKYFKDSEKRFSQPLRLYFLINFIFFLLIPILSNSQFQIFSFSLKSLTRSNHFYQNIIEGQIKAGEISEEIYEERFNSHLKYSQPAFVFLIIPVFAFVLNLVYFNKKRYYLEHLFFSIHFISFFLLSLIVIITSYRILTFGLNYFFDSSGYVAGFVLIVLFIWLFVYLYIASKSFYRDNIFSNLLKIPLLMIGLFATMGLYTQFLFFYTILALRWGY